MSSAAVEAGKTESAPQRRRFGRSRITASATMVLIHAGSTASFSASSGDAPVAVLAGAFGLGIFAWTMAARRRDDRKPEFSWGEDARERCLMATVIQIALSCLFIMRSNDGIHIWALGSALLFAVTATMMRAWSKEDAVRKAFEEAEVKRRVAQEAAAREAEAARVRAEAKKKERVRIRYGES